MIDQFNFMTNFQKPKKTKKAQEDKERQKREKTTFNHIGKTRNFKFR